MDAKDLNIRIDELDRKMDLILDIVNHQKMKTEEVQDLVDDLTIVGKDVYDSAVEELENQRVELDPCELRNLGISLMRNVKNLNKAVALFESASDFAKDAEPIVHDAVLDLTRWFNELDKKGYFELLMELGKVVDSVVTQVSVEDVRAMADNIPAFIKIVKNVTKPEMLNNINKAVEVLNSTEADKIPEYSLFKMMRELNKPEMKKTMGFMVTMAKGLAASDEK